MPNLINNGDQANLAQNYRRVRVSDSNLGTRRIQFYEVTIYGMSDADIAIVVNTPWRTVQEEGSLDSTDAYELTTASVLEAIVRGVQKTSELYIVGEWDWYWEDPDYNDLELTIGVAADTVESSFEYGEHAGYGANAFNPNYQSIEQAVQDTVDDFNLNDGYDYIEVIAVQISGSSTDSTNPGNALGRNNPLNAAVKAAKKAARLASRKTPPQFKKPR